MRRIQLIAFIGLILIFSSCGKDLNSLSAINSESFSEKQISIHFQSDWLTGNDSLVDSGLKNLPDDQQIILNQMNEMNSMVEKIRKSESDSDWVTLVRKWTKFNKDFFGVDKTPLQNKYSQSDSLNNKMFPEAIRKWTKLNIDLLKLSGEVRFGDALEKIFYSPYQASVSENLIKSVIYTHVYDQVYVNIIGSSSVDYTHTTGGNVRIIQETNYPIGNDIILKSECNDLRYMDLFIRIPSWAVNPTVTHGNVKYVARPGEYCQISKKWITGDEIRIVLKN